MCEDYRLTRYCDDYHDINERKQKLEALIKRECPHTRIIYNKIRDRGLYYIREFMQIYNSRCAYCGVSNRVLTNVHLFEVDHFICESSFSGSSKGVDSGCISNLVLSCKCCNRDKSNFTWPIEYNKFIKPLINCQRKEIEAYCQKQQLNPRIDSTNKENTYTRNKIRNIIIPELTKINPNIIKTLQRTTEIIKEENSYIEKQVQIKYKKLAHISKKCIEFSLKEIRIEDKAIQKRLINKAISGLLNSTNNVSKINIDDIIKMIERNVGNKTIKINKKIEILIKNKKIFINLVH